MIKITVVILSCADIKTVREEGEIPIQRHQQRPAGHAAARAAQEEITDAACPVQRTVR